MKVVMFTGQGSQYRGMGKELFKLYPNETQQASEILGYDIAELCLEDKNRKLGQTQFTQPALYVVNALSYNNKNLVDPDYLIGHSLGEYNALLASKVFDFETGLKLVQKRGALMAEASGGGMAAVLGISVDVLIKLLDEEGLHEIDIANYNTPTQTVISGPQREVNKMVKSFTSKGIKCIPLFVSAPFHSRYMKSVSIEFREFLNSFSFSPLQVPVIANNSARLYSNEDVKQTLSEQICSSVKWTDTIEFLLEKGVTDYQEVGGGILTKMVENIMKYRCSDIPKTVVDKKELIESGNSEVVINKDKLKKLTGRSLGNKEFREEFKLDYSYVAGAMYRGISSKELVVRMGKANMLSFLGTGGWGSKQIEENILFIKSKLTKEQPFGVNLLSNIEHPELDMELVELCLSHQIEYIEVAAFMQVTAAVAYYHLTGLKKGLNGKIINSHKIMAKISRPEVAEVFMKPVSDRVIKKLLDLGKVTIEQAELGKHIPVCQAICVEADSGGHTDQGVATVILPSIQALRDTIQKEYRYEKPIFIGLAGGIGTHGAAAAAFVMGADFILTGSINQCSVEAGISEEVKDMLQHINVQDTEYAPAGDMFEIGAKVQVLKKETLFAARANKLYSLYAQYKSIDELPQVMVSRLEKMYFKKSINEIWEEVKSYKIGKGKEGEVLDAEINGKKKMAMIFKWYFANSSKSTFSGDVKNKVNFQVHTGPALGAFNQWVKGTEYADWRGRNVDKMGEMIMEEASVLIQEKFINNFR